MKFIISLCLLSLTCFSQADNLLSEVQANINKSDIVTFSAQALQLKFCPDCPIRKLSAAANVLYWNGNDQITQQQALEEYVRGNYSFIAVFYNRDQQQYSQIVFNGFSEFEPKRYFSTYRK